MARSEILAAEYRGQARRAMATAEASLLPQVRLKHQLAVSAWLDLAVFQDQRTAHSAAVAARLAVAADPGAPAPISRDAPCTT